MSSLREFCEFSCTWEVQDSKKFSSILHCEKFSEESLNELGIQPNKESADPPPVQQQPPSISEPRSAQSLEREFAYSPLQIKPFLHPELTRPSACEVRVFFPPRHHLRLARLIVVSTARNLEYYDRMGEYIATVKGEKVPKQSAECKTASAARAPAGGVSPNGAPPNLQQQHSGGSTHSEQWKKNRWYRCIFTPTTECFEVTIKVVGSLDPNVLLIRFLGLALVPHDWSDVGLISATPYPLMERVQELLASAVAASSPGSTGSGDPNAAHQRNRSVSLHSQTNTLLANLLAGNPSQPAGSSGRSASPNPAQLGDSPAGGGPRRSLDYSQLRGWLETRLTALETTLLSRMDQLSTRLDQVEARLPTETGRQ